LPSDREAASAAARSITEQVPSGGVNLAMVEAVKEELDRRARLDAEMAQREADKVDYRNQPSSRR
jgi:hypothetical protein